MAAARRRVRHAQAVLALSLSAFVIVLWQQGGSLASRARIAEEAVTTLRREILPSGSMDATAVLPAVAALDTVHLATYLLPASLPASLDQDTRRLAILAIRKLVLSGVPETGVDTRGEIDARRHFAAQLDHAMLLPERIGQYERFRQSRSAADLADLLGASAGAVPAIDDAFVAKAVAGMDLPEIDRQDMKAAARGQTLRLGDVLASRTFKSAEVRSRIATLSGLLNALNKAVGKGTLDKAVLRPVIDEYDGLRSVLARPDAALEAAATGRLPNDLQGLLDQTRRADWLGPEIADSLSMTFTRAAAGLQAEMLRAEASQVGRLIVRTETSPWFAPGSSLMSLVSSLETLSRQLYMTEAELPDSGKDPARLLDQAKLARDAHGTLRSNHSLPEAMAKAADTKLAQYLWTRLLHVLTGPTPPDQAASIVTSASQDIRDLAIATQGSLEPDARSELDKALNGQASRLLDRTDAFFKAHKPYDAISIAALDWQGEAGVVRHAFGAADTGTFSRMMAETRSDIAEVIGTDILPAIDLVAGSSAADPSLASKLRKWQSLAELSLRPIDEMENFIKLTDGMDQSSCLEATRAFHVASGGDPVSITRMKAQSIFASRCADLAKSARRNQVPSAPALSASASSSLAAVFAPLANHFPFVGSQGPIDAPDASPRDVRKFLRQFDLVKTQALQEAAGEGRRKSVELRLFVDQIDSARPLLDSLTASDRNPDPIAVELTYGINRMAEIGSGEIIDWSVRSATSAVGPGTRSQVMQWVPGEPLLMSFRWAAGSKFRPRRDDGNASLSVRDDTLTIVERGPWALLRLIQLRRVGTMGMGAAAADGTVIRVALPTRTVTGTAAPDTVLFLGMRIKARSGVEPGRMPVLPDRFPE